jgi:phosphate transport system substrate-binding protein
MNNKFKITSLLIILITISVFFGCKKRDDLERTVISVKGSDTMVNLSQRWAEEYMKNNPGISIQVTGGGSGTGVAALLNGTTDIANSSRELKPSEYEKAATLNINPVTHEVAMDGIAVITHPSNKIQSLTIKQVSEIFSGKITNWKQLGGDDLPITLYGRENSSGTYEFLKITFWVKIRVNKQIDFATSTQVLQGTAALGEAVARDNKGIGYGGVGYFAERNDIKILPLKKDGGSEAIAPAQNGKVNYEAIWNGNYPVARYLYCFTNGEVKDAVQNFLNFIVSEEGQKLVETMEYIPLPKNNLGSKI